MTTPHGEESPLSRPLPPLVLAVQPQAGCRTTLVATRAEDGTITAGIETWPRPVPLGALLLHWPARFIWTPAGAGFLDAIRSRDGAAFPLGVVLQKLGLSSPRTAAQLARILKTGLEEIEDPGLFGRKVLAALAAKLAAPALQPEGWYPAPALAEVIAALPAAPGVYRFLAADGSLLYVGKARSLRRRVPRHFGPGAVEAGKSRELARGAADLAWDEAGSDLEALLREQRHLSRGRPPLNRQERVHRRPRGSWRRAVVLLALPSPARGAVELCLVAGDGRFHWERVPRAPRLPAGLWKRLCGFLDGDLGWAPGEAGVMLTLAEAAALAEIALSWLARHGDRVTRIDLAGETRGRHLQARLRGLLAADPSGERTESR